MAACSPTTPPAAAQAARQAGTGCRHLTHTAPSCRHYWPAHGAAAPLQQPGRSSCCSSPPELHSSTAGAPTTSRRKARSCRLQVRKQYRQPSGWRQWGLPQRACGGGWCAGSGLSLYPKPARAGWGGTHFKQARRLCGWSWCSSGLQHPCRRVGCRQRHQQGPHAAPLTQQVERIGAAVPCRQERQVVGPVVGGGAEARHADDRRPRCAGTQIADTVAAPAPPPLPDARLHLRLVPLWCLAAAQRQLGGWGLRVAGRSRVRRLQRRPAQRRRRRLLAAAGGLDCKRLAAAALCAQRAAH